MSTCVRVRVCIIRFSVTYLVTNEIYRLVLLWSRCWWTAKLFLLFQNCALLHAWRPILTENRVDDFSFGRQVSRVTATIVNLPWLCAPISCRAVTRTLFCWSIELQIWINCMQSNDWICIAVDICCWIKLFFLLFFSLRVNWKALGHRQLALLSNMIMDRNM